jgi:hypothetical protein
MVIMGLMMVLLWGGVIILDVWLFRSSIGGNAYRVSDRPDGDLQGRLSGNHALE